MRCLIIDDEELARALLHNYVSRTPGLSLLGEFKNPLEALPVLQSEPVDLLFLDIQMPEMRGTDFLKTLKVKPLAVLTTAYSEYALQGYELDVVDYLLKPFSFDRFLQAVNKASERSRPPQENTAEKDFILVKSGHRVLRLRLDDILFMEGMAEYVAFHTRSQGRILSLTSLKKLEEELPADRFLRIHKSYMVAIGQIAALEGNHLTLGKEKLPIGASYREEVLRRCF